MESLHEQDRLTLLVTRFSCSGEIGEPLIFHIMMFYNRTSMRVYSIYHTSVLLKRYLCDDNWKKLFLCIDNEGRTILHNLFTWQPFYSDSLAKICLHCLNCIMNTLSSEERVNLLICQDFSGSSLLHRCWEGSPRQSTMTTINIVAQVLADQTAKVFQSPCNKMDWTVAHFVIEEATICEDSSQIDEEYCEETRFAKTILEILGKWTDPVELLSIQNTEGKTPLHYSGKGESTHALFY